MSTSSDVLQSLEQARGAARTALKQIDDLIVEHDYQDVATLIAQAADALLEAAAHLMQSNDEAAFDAIERADDLLDSVYAVVEGDLDEEE
jgi:hypothetical protein